MLDSFNEPEEDTGSFILGLIVVAMVIYGAYQLNKYGIEHPTVCTTHHVVEIGQCTAATSDAWNGTNNGECATKLDNGTRVNMDAPVMLGDAYRICE